MRWRSGRASTCWRMALKRSRRSRLSSAPGGAVGDVRRGSGLGVGLVEVDGGGGALVAGVARVVDAEVGGNAVEPGAEAGLGAVGLAGTVDAQEDLLGKLLGDGLVVHHAVHKVDDRAGGTSGSGSRSRTYCRRAAPA